MLRGFNLIKQLQESKAVIGLNMLARWDDRGTLQPRIEPLSRAISDGVVNPVVHAAVPFAKAGEATASWRRARTSARWCWCPDRLYAVARACSSNVGSCAHTINRSGSLR
jgi:hypothetical protein